MDGESTATATAENAENNITIAHDENNEIEKILEEPIQNEADFTTKDFDLDFKGTTNEENILQQETGGNNETVETGDTIELTTENNNLNKENGVITIDENLEVAEKTDKLNVSDEVDETVENVRQTIAKMEKGETHEIVEISEISDVTEEVTSADETVEYTIVEEESADESAANVDDEETQTVFLVGYNSSEEGDKLDDAEECQVFVVSEEQEEEEAEKEVEAEEEPEEEEEAPPVKQIKKEKPRKPRGRRPIGDIPLHVLGRDISKPTEGNKNGGRLMPKPRLGVKVPYRNLTSQIVSKEEIQKEIMDRFKNKQEQNATNAGDIFFARKLTQRLARKLIPEKPIDTKSPLRGRAEQSASTMISSDMRIKDNSDLIAILEGDDNEPLSKEKQAESEEFIKNVEKEIALQQLKELPLTKNRFFKSKEKKEPVQSPKKPEVKKQEVAKPKEANISTTATPVKSQSGKQEKEKKQVEVEPQLTADMVIKTYARKRKSFEKEREVSPSPPPLKKQVSDEKPEKPEKPEKIEKVVEKKTAATPQSSPDVYVTKSSRIIKKKVIWDPDDDAAKTPVKLESMVVKSGAKTETIKSPKSDNSKPPKLVAEPSAVAAAAAAAAAATPKQAEKKATAEKTGESSKSSDSKPPIMVKKVIVKSDSRGGTPQKKYNKRLTEVDKLLMDEGAVNMLYDVNNTEDSTKERIKQKAKSIISLDKVQKALISKTNMIKKDLLDQTQEQKSLRKKPGTPTKREVVSGPTNAPLRKKSKDSSRSSVHSPPLSPFSNAEASRIIRRHSSSSFSSVENAPDEQSETPEKRTRRKASSNANNAETTPKKKIKKEKKAEKAPEKTLDPRFEEHKFVEVEKCDKSFTVILLNDFLNVEMLEELIECLKVLETDDDCRVVCFKSTSSSCFCKGLDYRILQVENEDERKEKATQLATLVKEFLKCLLNFPKILVACIQGNSIGLSVTMLPLFDFIIASDNSTFSTPYASLGCSAEAGFLLAPPYLNSNTLAFDLLFLSKTIKADEALKNGLITKLCWPEKYEEEIKKLLESISEISKQCTESNKKQLRHNLAQSAGIAIDSQSTVLIEHWISTECQENFSSLEVD